MRQAAAQGLQTAIVASPYTGVRVSVGKMSNPLINNNNLRLAPRRGIRNPLRNKRLRVPTLKICPVRFQGLTGNVPTRLVLRRRARQICSRVRQRRRLAGHPISSRSGARVDRELKCVS